MLRLFGSAGLLFLMSAILALVTQAWFFRILTLVLGLIIIGGYTYLRQSMAKRAGTLQLAGLKDQVDVYVDDRGIPHIYAGNLHDLYMAQGYVTAQDRLFAMDMNRRVAAGRLSEVLGPQSLDLDRHFRTIGLHRAAAASVATHSPQALEALEAFAAGVNARIAEGRLPVEFQLLGYRPEPWAPEDSLLVGRYAAYYLVGNWDRELFRGQLIHAVGAKKAAELFWLPPDDNLLRTAESTPLPDVERLLDIAAATLHETSGTNGWVAGGSKTRSGAPILANDPHLATTAPSMWYQTHLVGPSALDVTGVTFPGIPGILLGHNRDIAWGSTNLNADCQDVYMEQIKPGEGDHFRYGDTWEKAQRIQEPIRVKGSTVPVQHEVLVSRHGPIIARGDTIALALRWTGLEPSSDLDTFLAINRARNWHEFRSALCHYNTPVQQFLFAGKDGTIATRAAGRIPLRRRGDGQAPVAGWTGEYEWAGVVAFDQLPENLNPHEDYIAAGDDGSASAGLGSGWMPPYRSLLISERLQNAADLTAERMQHLQTETVNYHARSLLQTLLNAIQEGLRQGPHPETLNETEKRAMLLLSGWDCCEAPGAPAPLLWHQWYLFLLEGIFRPQMGLALYDRFVASGMPTQVADRLILQVSMGGDSLWLANEGEGGLSRIALRAFRRAVGYLAAKHGSRPERWRWGKEHSITFRHLLSRPKRWLRPFLNLGPYPLGGSAVTLNRPGFSQLQPFQVTVAANWRHVVDMSAPDDARDIAAPGQSSHPLSPHYADQLGAWMRGESQTMLVRHKEIHKYRSLVLKPKQ